MKHSFFFLVLLMASAASTSFAGEGGADATRPVVFSQETDAWGLHVRAHGTVENYEKSLTVKLSELVLESNPKNQKGSQTNSYTVCLAFWRSEQVWDMANCAKPVKHKKRFDNAEAETIKDAVFTIEKVEKVPLKSFWLVLMVENNRVRNGYNKTFAKSQADALSFPSSIISP